MLPMPRNPPGISGAPAIPYVEPLGIVTLRAGATLEWRQQDPPGLRQTFQRLGMTIPPAHRVRGAIASIRSGDSAFGVDTLTFPCSAALETMASA
jgi:hypothetical protein